MLFPFCFSMNMLMFFFPKENQWLYSTAMTASTFYPKNKQKENKASILVKVSTILCYCMCWLLILVLLWRSFVSFHLSFYFFCFDFSFSMAVCFGLLSISFVYWLFVRTSWFMFRCHSYCCWNFVFRSICLSTVLFVVFFFIVLISHTILRAHFLLMFPLGLSLHWFYKEYIHCLKERKKWKMCWDAEVNFCTCWLVIVVLAW